MLCRDSGFTPNVVQETEDVVTSIALVSLGFGVCCVPESTVNLKLPNVAYVPLYSPTPKIDLDCVYRKDIDSTILDAFLAIVRDYGNGTSYRFVKVMNSERLHASGAIAGYLLFAMILMSIINGLSSSVSAFLCRHTGMVGRVDNVP